MTERRICIGCGFGIPKWVHHFRVCCDECEPWRRMLMFRAMLMTRRAWARGEMADPRTLVCVDCGTKAKCYDHRDYMRPLVVEPVCHGCNIRRGPARFALPPSNECHDDRSRSVRATA